MSSNDPVESVPKSIKQKRAKISVWILSASGFAFLGALLSLYFLPVAIILFMIALIIVGIQVFQNEADDVLETEE